MVLQETPVSAGDVDRVVAANAEFGPQLAKALHQVVGERAVVTNHQ